MVDAIVSRGSGHQLHQTLGALGRNCAGIAVGFHRRNRFQQVGVDAINGAHDLVEAVHVPNRLAVHALGGCEPGRRGQQRQYQNQGLQPLHCYRTPHNCTYAGARLSPDNLQAPYVGDTMRTRQALGHPRPTRQPGSTTRCDPQRRYSLVISMRAVTTSSISASLRRG